MNIKLSFTIPKQVTTLLAPLKPVLKHHYFIYAVLLLVGLVFAVYIVNDTLAMPSDDSYRQQKQAESLKGNFDPATIKKIEELNKSSETSTAPTPPAGVRSNPFAE